jgi:16S rRNA (adenine(1408)-N(1))-methyltransferase
VVRGSSNSAEPISRTWSGHTGGGVVVDIGTGDGRYVYRSARANPDQFYIGIDVERKALEKVSERIHRKTEKGGLPNALFVHSSVEDLPAELDDVADEIHVHFPWGSLLRAVAVGDEAVLGGLRRIASPDAWLEVLIGIDEVRDAGEARRLQLPPLTDEYLREALVPRYAMAGFHVQESGITAASEWPHLETTWAKRLRGNDRRQLLFLIARAAPVRPSLVGREGQDK